MLCAHNMITETAVQKKTGTSAARIVIVRTVSAFTLAFLLNRILPGGMKEIAGGGYASDVDFMTLFKEWLSSTAVVVVKMTTLIYTLAIVQKIL